MRPRARLFVASAALALPLSACGGSPAPPAPARPVAAPAPAKPAAPGTSGAPAKPATPGPQAQAAASATASAVVPVTAIKYEAKGRRDPFAPLETHDATKVATVAAAKLRGIVRGGRGTLALVDTAEGVGYILKQGDTLADGRLVEIGQDSVVFAVAPKPGTATTRIVLRLPAD